MALSLDMTVHFEKLVAGFSRNHKCHASLTSARAWNAAMPVVFRDRGFRFFFYSNEGSPREPLHVHVRSGSSEAKIWLDPQVQVASSFGFDAGTLRELVEVAQANRVLIERTWHEYFS